MDSLKYDKKKIENTLNLCKKAGKELTEFLEELISKRDTNLKILRNIKKEMTKGELCAILIDIVNDYREQGVLQSIEKNKHMNNYDGEKIKDTTIDAILVDFINYVATWQGLDLALYTKHLKKI